MSRKIFFFLLIAIVYYACEAENAQPDADGELVELTCKFDNEDFKAFQNWGFNHMLRDVGANLSNSILNIGGDINLDKDTRSISLKANIDTLDALKTYNLDFEENALWLDTGKKTGIFYLDTLFKREIKITRFDPIKKIIGGEFNFRAIDDKDTVVVTEGKFNLKFQKY
jgi:hypothetical protein